MATRNLARTVVEGGRSSFSKMSRRARNRRERRLRFDEEGNVFGKARRTEYRGFADRLAPLQRWLGRHVGHGWSNVYREFCERHDRRTMKGWHLADHLLFMVDKGRFSGGPFFVDGRGILRVRPRRPRWSSPSTHAGEMRARAWAAGRRVIVHGEAAFWTAKTVDTLEPTSPQGRRLTPAELAVWSSFAPAVRDALTYTALRRCMPVRGGREGRAGRV